MLGVLPIQTFALVHEWLMYKSFNASGSPLVQESLTLWGGSEHSIPLYPHAGNIVKEKEMALG